MSVVQQLAHDDRLVNAAIAVLLAATFALALALRARQNTNRILAERRMQARLRQTADYIPEIDPAEKAAIRARLLGPAAYFPDAGDPYTLPFNVREFYARPAASRYRHYRIGGQR